MAAIRTVAITIAMLFLGTNAFGENPSAIEILKKVAAKYKTMKTYKAEGTITIVDEANTNQEKPVFSYSILLKKPNMYLITWTETNTLPGKDNSGAAWSDGTQPYLYFGMANAFWKMTNDEMALSVADYYCMFTSTIPSLFLPVFKEHEAPFYWLKNPKVEKVEKIGGEDCYVISGTSAVSKRETIWVSKKSYLIRKCYRSKDYAKWLRQIPGITHKEIEERLEMNKILMGPSFSMEVYTEMSSPELNKGDFNYAMPEGAVLNDKWFINK